MKYKALTAAALLLAGGLSALALARPVSAVKCPPGSERNKNGTDFVEVSDISSVAQCNLPKEEKGEDLLSQIAKVINVILGMVGIIAVVVIIIGGISFITSQGDPGKVTKARNTILYGVVGIAVALLAFAIVNFVLTGIFGGSSTTKSKDKTPPKTSLVISANKQYC